MTEAKALGVNAGQKWDRGGVPMGKLEGEMGKGG